MAARQPQYSPKQIAEALGVSESSVKRWCDQGAIPTIRTIGGHRRITLDGLREFLQKTGRTLLAPELLGLPKLHVGRASNIPGGTHPEQVAFREALVEGDEDACRTALSRQIRNGFTRYEAAEFLVTDAMEGIGLAWAKKAIDPYQERRGCNICVRLINELHSDIPPVGDQAPVAIGGAPAGDQYQLPTALIELTLREIGWQATSLGANLPADSFIQACYDYQPALVWMSISFIENAPIFVAEQNRVAASIGEDTPLILGGRAVVDEVRPRLRYTAFCDSMRQLSELASMMRMRLR